VDEGSRGGAEIFSGIGLYDDRGLRVEEGRVWWGWDRGGLNFGILEVGSGFWGCFGWYCYFSCRDWGG